MVEKGAEALTNFLKESGSNVRTQLSGEGCVSITIRVHHCKVEQAEAHKQSTILLNNYFPKHKAH